MKRIVGSGGGGSSSSSSEVRVAVEDPDSLQSHQYAKIVDLLSEGEIGGLVDGLKSVILDDTPVLSAAGTANHTGVTLDHRLGKNDQTQMPGFSDVESEASVNVEIKHNAPIVRTVSGEIDAARVTLGFPCLTQQNTTNGDLHGTGVSISIDVNNNGGGFKPAPLRWEFIGGVVSAGSQVDAADAFGVSLTVNMAFPATRVWVPDPPRAQTGSSGHTDYYSGDDDNGGGGDSGGGGGD